jgi:hypothetical protein
MFAGPRVLTQLKFLIRDKIKPQEYASFGSAPKYEIKTMASGLMPLLVLKYEIHTKYLRENPCISYPLLYRLCHSTPKQLKSEKTSTYTQTKFIKMHT